MNNFADSTLVSALLGTFKPEEVTRENWTQIETATVSRIADLLAVDSIKAKEIFRNGIVSILTANK